jgi:hypothetical protein
MTVVRRVGDTERDLGTLGNLATGGHHQIQLGKRFSALEDPSQGQLPLPSPLDPSQRPAPRGPCPISLWLLSTVKCSSLPRGSSFHGLGRAPLRQSVE